MSRRGRSGNHRPVLRLMLLLVLLPDVASAAVDPIDPWRGFIDEASLRFGVPSAWIAQVMRAESGGHTMRGGRPIRSSKGAIGLMQLMPQTWSELRGRLDLGVDPDDPRDNILAGAAYLRLMYDRFGYPGLFAAYDAGPARYAAYLRGQTRLPRETIAYLAQVTRGAAALPMTTQAVADAVENKPRNPLFAVRATAPAGSETAPAAAPTPSLFAIRHDGE